MSTIAKNPDRINITKKAKTIIDKIDKSKYLNLDSTTATRSELFTFAMALGIDTIPTILENVHPGGFILESSIDDMTKALAYASFISKLPNIDMLDNIDNKDSVYNKAQEYANTGFEILDYYVENKKDYELIWDLLEELDNQYYENVEN